MVIDIMLRKTPSWKATSNIQAGILFSSSSESNDETITDDEVFSFWKKRSSNRICILDGTKIRRITPAAWEEIVPENVDSIPAHIDGVCAYAVDGLEGTKDERKWQKDSSTKWAGYSSVRYRNCNGSFSCQNPLSLLHSVF